MEPDLLNLAQRKRLNPHDPLANPVYIMRSNKDQTDLSKLNLNGFARQIAKKEAKQHQKFSVEIQKLMQIERLAEEKEIKKERKRVKRELQKQAMKQ